MLVDLSGGDGYGYVGAGGIKVCHELAVKDEETGRVWGVIFGWIVVFS